MAGEKMPLQLARVSLAYRRKHDAASIVGKPPECLKIIWAAGVEVLRDGV